MSPSVPTSMWAQTFVPSSGKRKGSPASALTGSTTAGRVLGCDLAVGEHDRDDLAGEPHDVGRDGRPRHPRLDARKVGRERLQVDVGRR
jgi:hypothetical protein